MIEFGGITYYIDLDAIDKKITLPLSSETIKITEVKIVRDPMGNIAGSEETTSVSDKEKQVDGPMYELIRTMLEVLIDYDEEHDDSLGIERALAKTPISFKLAFNTLYHYGILKEKE